MIAKVCTAMYGQELPLSVLSFSFPAAMPFFDTAKPSPDLAQHLQQHPDSLIVACYCAAWCNTCAGYKINFEQLAQAWPDHTFVWIDIEEAPELLGDEDIENFPTLLMQSAGQYLFFGTLQPHIQHLEGLLQRTGTLPAVTPDIPSLRAALADK